MNAVAAAKSRMQNLLEGMTLTALFQGIPTFGGAAMMLKLVGSSQIVNDPGGVLIFVAMASLFHAMLTPWLAAKFPRLRHNYEPLFFDATLSFAEKLLRWRTQPAASLQLLTNVLMLSLLAVAVLTVG